MPPVIETKNLTKYYGKTKGAKSLNLDIKKGEIFGFLGPNGAGKTTTIRLLLRLINPTEGEAFLFGKSVHENYSEVLKDVGYLPAELSLYENMTGAQMVSFFDSFYKTKDSKENTKYREDIEKRLKCQMNKKFKDLSTGNKKKIGILLSVFHQPKLLVLDEPTSGLDPITQNEFYKIIFELQQKGTTVFFSSHNLPEVERVCDRVGIIKDGDLIKVEKIKELRRHRKKEVNVYLKGSDNNKEKLEELPGVDVIEDSEGFISIHVEGGRIRDVIKVLAEMDVEDVDITYPDLEDVFLKYYEDSSPEAGKE